MAAITHWMTEEGPKITGLFAGTTRFLCNGDELHAARLELIRGARRCLYIAAYAFVPDATGQELLAELCQRARAGVDVRLMVDAGYGSRDLISAAGFSRWQQMLQDAGARALGFYGSTPSVLHEKLLLCDGVRYIAGGSGYADNYRNAGRASPVWHDMDVLITGASASFFHNRFINYWYELAKDTALALKGEATPMPDFQPWVYDEAAPLIPWWYRPDDADPGRMDWYRRRFGLESLRGGPVDGTDADRPFLGGTEKLVPIYGQPYYAPPDYRPALAAHLSAIAAATRDIRIWSPYFVPHRQVVDALLAARGRGVAVTVLTNSRESTDEKFKADFMASAMFRQIRELLPAGVAVLLWPGPSTLHRKGAIYDGGLAYMGSDNFDVRGQEFSSESVVYTDSAALLSTLRDEFAADAGRTAPLTPEVVQRSKSEINPVEEALGSAAYWLF